MSFDFEIPQTFPPTVMADKTENAGIFGLLLPDYRLPEAAEKQIDDFNFLEGGDEANRSTDLDGKYGSYLNSLTSYGVERLSREPMRVSGELNAVQQQLQELSFRNYRGFVGSAKCVRSVREDMESIVSNLGGMESILPSIADRCSEFATAAVNISRDRRRQQLMLEQHGTLLELLEIPQLMDTCVRNGHLEEALELEHFVKRLSRSHGEISVLRKLAEDVEKCSKSMERHLVSTLRQDSKLPAFLRAISYLRRLGTRSERDLRVTFLQCRTGWLEQLVDSIPKDENSIAVYLSKFTDCYRVNVFDIVTQYRAIFATDALDESAEVQSGTPLTEWIVERVNVYLREFEKHLPQVNVGAALSDILEQSMRLGFSLGRVGCDFRPLLAPLFVSRIETMVTTSLNTAVSRFKAQLNALAAGRTAIWTSSADDSASGSGSGTNSASAAASLSLSSLSPPTTLLIHPPMAVLSNAFTATLNELRHVAALAVRESLKVKYESALESIAVSVAECARRGGLGLNSTVSSSRRVRGTIDSVLRVCVDTLFPYLCQLFNTTYDVSSRGIRSDGAAASLILAPFLSSTVQMVPAAVEVKEVKDTSSSNPPKGISTV